MSRRSVSCSEPTGPDRSRKRPPRSSRSRCASHAPAVAVRCASSRRSVAVSNHGPGRHHRSRQHDATPVTLADPPPVPHQAPVSRPFAGPRPSSWLWPVPPRGPTRNPRHWGNAPAAEPGVASHAPVPDDRSANRQRSFPIDITRPHAASSLGGFQRAPRSRPHPPSRHGPHRKTFTLAAFGGWGGAINAASDPKVKDAAYASSPS